MTYVLAVSLTGIGLWIHNRYALAREQEFCRERQIAPFLAENGLDGRVEFVNFGEYVKSGRFISFAARLKVKDSGLFNALPPAEPPPLGHAFSKWTSGKGMRCYRLGTRGDTFLVDSGGGAAVLLGKDWVLKYGSLID